MSNGNEPANEFGKVAKAVLKDVLRDLAEEVRYELKVGMMKGELEDAVRSAVNNYLGNLNRETRKHAYKMVQLQEEAMRAGIPEFVTVRQAAARLKVTVCTVRRWLSNGSLKGRRVGLRWLIPMAEMQRLLG